MLSILIVHTEDEKTEGIVVFNSVGSVRSRNSEKGSDNGAKSTVEEAKGRQNSIPIAVPEDELPLSRYDHSNAYRVLSYSFDAFFGNRILLPAMKKKFPI